MLSLNATILRCGLTELGKGEEVKQQRKIVILMGVYVLIAAGALAIPFVTWNQGRHASIANPVHLLVAFVFVFFLTMAAFAALYDLRSGVNNYFVPASTLAMSVLLVAYAQREDIRASVAQARGHYYSIQYKNESTSDIFVVGVGELRVSRDSGSRGDYKLPAEIVWWEGTQYRKAKKSDKTFAVTTPKNLAKKATVVFTFTPDKRWEMAVEPL
ncbi:MAG: hypothetical protein ACTHOU_21695 [Aureliella sp.]